MTTKKSILFKSLFSIFILLQTAITYAGYQDDLIKAIEQSNVRSVNEILSNHVKSIDFKEINKKTKHKDTILTLASRLGDQEVVNTILKFFSPADVRVNQVNEDRLTPLYVAAQYGHTEVANLLIGKGADPNQAGNNGVTPLLIATQNGPIELVKLLIEKGADPNREMNDGSTPLHVAAQKGRIEIAKLLIEKGAHLRHPIIDGRSPLYVAVQNDHIEIAKLLIEKDANLNQTGNDGSTPLHVAAQNGNTEVVKLLIEKGADPTRARNDGSTPLHAAAQNGNTEVVKLLIEKGADLNKAMKNGATPLFLAAQNGNTEVVKFLIEKGADPNKALKDGATPLSISFYGNHLGITNEILASKKLSLLNESLLAARKSREFLDELNAVIKKRVELDIKEQETITKQQKTMDELKNKILPFFSKSTEGETELKNKVGEIGLAIVARLKKEKEKGTSESEAEKLEEIQKKRKEIKELEAKLGKMEQIKLEQLEELLAYAKSKEKDLPPEKVAEFKFEVGAMLLSKMDVDYKNEGLELLSEVQESGIKPLSEKATQLLASERAHLLLCSKVDPKETPRERMERYGEILELTETAGNAELYDRLVKEYLSEANPYSPAHPLYECKIEPGAKGTIKLLEAFKRMMLESKNGPSHVNDNFIKPGLSKPESLEPSGEKGKEDSSSGSARM